MSFILHELSWHQTTQELLKDLISVYHCPCIFMAMHKKEDINDENTIKILLKKSNSDKYLANECFECSFSLKVFSSWYQNIIAIESTVSFSNNTAISDDRDLISRSYKNSFYLLSLYDFPRFVVSSLEN